MFSSEQYTLGIPIKEDICNELQQLIFSIIEKEPSIGIDKNTTQKIEVKGEFHITLGVFHPSAFKSNKSMFKHIIHFLRQHKSVYSELKKVFKGNVLIKGIGFAHSNKLVNNVKDADVTYAVAESSEVNTIRSKIHDLLRFSGIDEKHFIFTDPHITLFIKSGKKDVHGVNKPLRIPLNSFLNKNKLNFNFETVVFYGTNNKAIATFGPNVKSKPSIKFGKILKTKIQEIKRNEVKSGPQYNWGNLFKDLEFRGKANEIKNILMDSSKGPKELAKLMGRDMGKVMKLLK